MDITTAALAFGTARADRDSVDYARARGAFYGALLALPEAEPPARPEPTEEDRRIMRENFREMLTHRHF